MTPTLLVIAIAIICAIVVTWAKRKKKPKRIRSAQHFR
jgi:FtsZ-interacting cell division protein ZipA